MVAAGRLKKVGVMVQLGGYMIGLGAGVEGLWRLVCKEEGYGSYELISSLGGGIIRKVRRFSHGR